MNIDYIFKIVVLGDSGVGKTSFIYKLNNDDFSKKGSTIGVDFSVHCVEIENTLIKLQIWDTAGQEQFKSITKSYFRNVAGALLFFDISNNQSYKNLSHWIDELLNHDVVEESIFIIANKTDLVKHIHINQYYKNHIKMYANSSYKQNSPKEICEIFTKHLLELYKSNKITKGVKDNSTTPTNIHIKPNKKQYYCC